MNMDEFYEQMKEALRTFELPWGAKDQVQVYVDIDGKVIFQFENKTFSIDP